ncbi:MAG: hypothetical protein ACLTZB_05820 [Streptococcus salivarius]
MPDVTGLTVSTAVQTLNRKNISSSSIEYTTIILVLS